MAKRSNKAGPKEAGPKRTFTKVGPRRQIFIRQWRKYRDMTQVALGSAMQAEDGEGMSSANVSRIETGQQPYTQDILEAIAEVLGCEPADLISRDPLSTNERDYIAAWGQLREPAKTQALAILRALADS